MESIILRDVVIEKTTFEKLRVFVDDNNNIIVLPTLWAMHIINTGSVFKWNRQRNFSASVFKFQSGRSSTVLNSFDASPVSENTISNYLGHFLHFLKFINTSNKTYNSPSVHNTELVNSKVINHYLNAILPKRVQSATTLTTHQAAISAYFSFLYDLEIKDITNSIIYKKTKQTMEELDSRPKKISYVSREERSSLIRLCGSLRDRLILRMGYEVGLRTEENIGLVLNNFRAKDSMQKGLLSLFEDLKNHKSKQHFEFTLNGKYTKGGKTRNIYFTRDLLISMKNYYDFERLAITQLSNKSSNTLFIRADNEGLGLPISGQQASNLFTKLRKQVPHMNETLSYHDLRHTFATELYHSELLNAEGRETRSESAALIVVSERLGHKNISSTIRYIRLRQQMLIIENGNYE